MQKAKTDYHCSHLSVDKPHLQISVRGHEIVPYLVPTGHLENLTGQVTILEAEMLKLQRLSQDTITSNGFLCTKHLRCICGLWEMRLPTERPAETDCPTSMLGQKHKWINARRSFQKCLMAQFNSTEVPFYVQSRI